MSAGKLVFRCSSVVFHKCPISPKDEILCTLHYDGKSGSCVGTGTSEFVRDAVVDVAEYHGAGVVKVQIFIKKELHIQNKFLRKFDFRKPSLKLLGSKEFPLLDAVPSFNKTLARQVADSYEGGSRSGSYAAANQQRWVAGYWPSLGQQPPETWKEYWPSLKINLAEAVIDGAILFVPNLSPDKCLGGFTEVHKAAYLNDARLVHMLLTSGSPNFTRCRESQLTPLDVAALRGHLDVACEILADSAHYFIMTPYPVGPDLKTCIHHAVASGNSELVTVLANHFAKQPCSFPFSQGAGEGQILVINLQDANKLTAIMLACEKNMANAVAHLADAGANLEIMNKNGDTCLIIACKSGSLESARALLDCKDPAMADMPVAPCLARPNRANHAGERALDCAAGVKDCPDLIRALLACFAVPGLRRPDGSTALHVAAAAGHFLNCKEIIHWVDNALADFQKSISNVTGQLPDCSATSLSQSLYISIARDVRGRLASELARAAGHEELANWLTCIETRDQERWRAFVKQRKELHGIVEGEDHDSFYDLYDWEFS